MTALVKRMTTVLVAAIFMVVGAVSAQAFELTFYNTSHNGDTDIADQLGLEVTDAGGGTFAFDFSNAGPLVSTIVGIYFGTDPYFGNNLTFDSYGASSGNVAFSAPATPGDVPGGIGWTSSYTVDADDKGLNGSGVDIYEWMIINFTSGLDLAALESAFANDMLVVGMHVTSIKGDYSDWFVTRIPENPIPEPATLLLLGSGLAGAAVWRKRKSA